MPKPHFFIKNHFQKRTVLYEQILTSEILRDVCLRITGRSDYTVEFDNNGYNIGRLATIEYNDSITYISFSETEIQSRNSPLQSFPSALIRYHLENNQNKNICFYFLPCEGKFETDYFKFIYALMKTAGTVFLNESEFLSSEIQLFTSVRDIIANRRLISGMNTHNNSTFLTRGVNNELQIFGKTYGANKYETTLLCIALSAITSEPIDLYEICEQDLRILPKKALEVIEALGKIRVIPTNMSMEQDEFEENDSLRSNTYTYNLLYKLGEKKCFLCNCSIPQLIHGAHVWPIASIKKSHQLTREEKLQNAIDGDNGIWLCENHHKLFDLDFLKVGENGQVKHLRSMDEDYKEYLYELTNKYQLPKDVLNPRFLVFLDKRNQLLEEANYCSFMH